MELVFVLILASLLILYMGIDMIFGISEMIEFIGKKWEIKKEKIQFKRTERYIESIKISDFFKNQTCYNFRINTLNDYFKTLESILLGYRIYNSNSEEIDMHMVLEYLVYKEEKLTVEEKMFNILVLQIAYIKYVENSEYIILNEEQTEIFDIINLYIQERIIQKQSLRDKAEFLRNESIRNSNKKLLNEYKKYNKKTETKDNKEIETKYIDKETKHNKEIETKYNNGMFNIKISMDKEEIYFSIKTRNLKQMFENSAENIEMKNIKNGKEEAFVEYILENLSKPSIYDNSTIKFWLPFEEIFSDILEYKNEFIE